MSAKKIIDAFEVWRDGGQPMVLATVFETAGSTYTKAGHRMIIAANGDYQGLVSGGCLEGDLAEHAKRVVQSLECMALTYDMRDEADELFGLGVGCNGMIRVFLQPMTAADAYAPFARIAAASLGRKRVLLGTVIASETRDLAEGTTVALCDGALEVWCGTVGNSDALSAELHATDWAAGARLYREAGATVLIAPLRHIPRLLVLGAGLDVLPVLRIATELGWIVSIADHRPAYLERGGFELAESIFLVDPARIHDTIRVEAFDAALVMSHHLETDKLYLRALATAPLGYLGVLGPPARRQRLLDALGEHAEALKTRLRGPVGLDIGADSPEAIALSFVAELHSVWCGQRGHV
jgi:xanthine dehydrogenase accessory factor